MIREAIANLKNPVFLWSVGKDSNTLLWLIRKAFMGRVPIPCVHIDTTFKIPEMIKFRDENAKAWNLDLRVVKNQSVLDQKLTFPHGQTTRQDCCTRLKRDGLKMLVDDFGFDGLILGIRRDEDGTRAKERVFSIRNADFSWDLKAQPPELWEHHNTSLKPGEHLRVHPLLEWSELDIWRYIKQENIPVVDLYFARDGKRYRSLGCAPCSAPISSAASTVDEIIEELEKLQDTERSTRAQDLESEGAFEHLRTSGYM